MPTYGGKDSRGKIIKVRPYEQEGDDKLLWLTERQRGLLLAMTEYLDWKTRWDSLPSPLDDDDARDAYVSGLKNRLMIVVEFCAEVINCIETDEDTQNVLKSFINSSLGNQPGAPGENLPNDILNTNIAGGTNPTCDYDILFAQCREIVHQTHLAVLDVLQKVEVTTNVAEFVDSLATAIPAISTLYDESGLDGVVQLFDYYQEAIAEQYEAQFTETVGGTFDELSYGLFCYCRNDCTITINKIVGFYQSRLSVYTSVPSFEGLVNLIEFIFGLNQDTTFVVDLAHFTAWAMIKFGNFLFGKYYNRTLEMLIRLKADEPSNDWEALELIFDECPEEVLLTPIVSIFSDFYPVPYGINLIPVTGEPGFWILESELHSSGAYVLTIEEENGQPFSIAGRSFPDGLVSANYYGLIGGVNTSLFFSSPQHDDMTQTHLAMFGGAANARFKFKFFRPA